jgi:hypothetical protein
MTTKQQQVKKIQTQVKATISKPVTPRVIEQKSEEEDSEDEVVEVPIVKESAKTIDNIKTVGDGGIRKRQRQIINKYVLSDRLSKEFRAPTRENSSVMGIHSSSGTSASLRIDLLVAAKGFVDACVDIADDLADASSDTGITLSHYRLKLTPFVVMTDLSNKKQTLVNPKSLKELVQSLEEYVQSNAATEGGSDLMEVDASDDDEACTQTLC